MADDKHTPPWVLITVAIIGAAGVIIAAIIATGNPKPYLPVVVVVTDVPVVQPSSTAQSQLHAEHNPVELAQPSPALEEGKRLYDQACAACHGPDGAGIPMLGNTFVASEFLAANDDAGVLAMIRAGREPGAADNRSGVAMPASGGRPDLTDGQLAAIIGYIRSEFAD